MNARSHLALIGFAWGALVRQKSRAMTVLGALTSTVALLAAVLFAQSSLRAEAASAQATQPDLVVQHLEGGRPALVDPAELSFLRELPGVRRLTARVWGYVFLPSLRAHVTLVGRGATGSELTSLRGAIAEGRDARPGEPHVAVLGASLAKLLRVTPGDVIALPSSRADAPALTVVGIFGSPVAIYTSDVLLVSQEDARSILDMPERRATDVALELAGPQEAPVVTRAIVEKMPGARVLDKRATSRTYRLMYGRRAGVILAASLPALLCLLILAWDRLGGLGPSERREIAVQKAVGWSTSDVLYAKLYESVLLALTAFGLGVLVAYAWVFVLPAPVLREVLAGWSVLYPTVPLTPTIDVADLFGVLGLVLFPFVGVSIVPAWRAATQDPMQAMR